MCLNYNNFVFWRLWYHYFMKMRSQLSRNHNFFLIALDKIITFYFINIKKFSLHSYEDFTMISTILVLSGVINPSLLKRFHPRNPKTTLVIYLAFIFTFPCCLLCSPTSLLDFHKMYCLVSQLLVSSI